MSKPIPKPKPMRKKTPDYQIYNHKDTRIECHKRFNICPVLIIKPLVTFNTDVFVIVSLVIWCLFPYWFWYRLRHGTIKSVRFCKQN